jgi:hypothetical protein
VADDDIPIAIENRYFAVMRENALAAFMVEHNNVVGFVLFVVDDYLRASFAEGLDDLRGLRSGAAARTAGKGIARTPLLPVICQDWLSVMKTRALCASEV